MANEYRIKRISTDNNNSQNWWEPLTSILKRKLFQLQYGKVQERNIRQPHNKIKVNPFKSFLHKLTNCVKIKPCQVAWYSACLCDKSLEYINSKICSKEGKHEEEYWCVDLNEWLSVICCWSEKSTTCLDLLWCGVVCDCCATACEWHRLKRVEELSHFWVAAWGMEQHHLGELYIEISCAHLSKCYRTYTCTQIYLGHCLSNVACKSWHVRCWSILIHCLIHTSLTLDIHIIWDTLTTWWFARTIYTIVDTFLAIQNFVSLVHEGEVINWTIVKTFYFVQ